jgi:SAM-dependent methyltransferase
MYRFVERDDCRVCGSSELIPYLDLGSQPPSNAFIPREAIPHEVRIPLVVNRCDRCGHSQLSVVVSADETFGEYAYRSSSSRALVESFRGLSEDVQPYADRMGRGALIVDLGCNDGLFLSQLPRDQYRVLGVEPSSAAEDARQRGLEVVSRFFGEQAARDLRDEYGPAQVITTSNVLAHVDDMHSFLAGVSAWLAPRGCYVLEFPYLGDLLEGLWFDTVYHEHVSYLAITPLTRALAEHGLVITRIVRHEVGGSGPFVRVFIEHGDPSAGASGDARLFMRREEIWGLTSEPSYAAFSSAVKRLCDVLGSMLDEISNGGRRLGGFGAPAKGNTLLNTLRLTDDTLVAVADNTPVKIGLVTPGSHVPIVDDEAFLALDIDVALLLSWNYAEYFMKYSEYIRRGGTFLSPFPTPSLMSHMTRVSLKD